MNYSDVIFNVEGGKFRHNLDSDYAFFALWKAARPLRDRIRSFLNVHFELALESEIEWSEEYFHSNAARLYEEPLFHDLQQHQRQSTHASKVGDRNFVIFIVRDPKPDYTYAQSVSGKIELSNLNIVKAKYQFRDWVKEISDEKYGVHSTNNIYEFFFQVPLILGPSLFKRLLRGENIGTCGLLKKDLEGASGWDNYESLFEILNYTNNYLVLRSFETLPVVNEEKDIDVLAENYQRFSSTLGLVQLRKHPYKGSVRVNNEEISIDVRFLGDKYYCVNWEQDMLRHKKMNKGVFVPRNDDYFFSLLHHCKVQKSSIKDKYYEILNSLAKNLSFTWFNISMLEDDQKVASILNGYYAAQNYYYEDPFDSGVFKNANVIKYLSSPGGPESNDLFVRKVKRNIKRALPNRMVIIIKKMVGK